MKISLMLAAATLVACAPAHADNPWHYNIVTVNFWIGQVIIHGFRRLPEGFGIRPPLGGQLRRL